MSRAVMQQALEALVAAYQGKDKTGQVTEAITALRAALAEPEQEPIGYVNPQYASEMQQKRLPHTWLHAQKDIEANVAVYTAPIPQPEQKGWFTVSELNEWATKLPQTTHWEGCEAVHPECRKQEPVGWQWLDTANYRKKLPVNAIPEHWRPLYTTPTPQPDTDCHAQGVCQRSGYSIAPTPRNPLTDEEIVTIWGQKPRWHAPPIGSTDIEFARAVIAAYEAKQGEQT